MKATNHFWDIRCLELVVPSANHHDHGGKDEDVHGKEEPEEPLGIIKPNFLLIFDK